MKILYIHNEYHQLSGEEHASREIVSLLKSHGHEVRWFTRTTVGKENVLWFKFKAFFTGISNPWIRKDLKKILDEFKPDICMVQNLYPFISTSIFKVLKERGIPVAMRCPNYRLFCPNGLCLNPRGEVCEKCWGKGHEWHCIINNCEGSLGKSIGYAARNAFNRITKVIKNGVDCFVVQSNFQKNKFISQDIPEDHVKVLAGLLPEIGEMEQKESGEWVSFVGRVSMEKGIDEFVEAARMLPDIPFRVAGKIDENYVVPSNLPKNLEFMGFISGDDLNNFYLNSKIIVIPSKWYEGFPNTILRAMLLKRPVITTNIGAMQSIIEDHKTGILVPPGDSQALMEAVRELYNDEQNISKYAMAGYDKATTMYSRGQIYNDLMEIFNVAIKNSRNSDTLNNP